MKLLSLLTLSPLLLWADWTATGNDPAYPAELYFVGFGLSDQNLEKAKRQAQNDVQRQIRVNLHSKVVDQTYSEKRGEKEFVEENARMNMFAVGMGEIAGIQIVKTEKRDHLFYALAILDKALFSQNLRQKITQLNTEIEGHFQSALAFQNQGKVAEAFSLLVDIQKKRLQAEDLKKSLSAVESPDASLNAQVSSEQIDTTIGRLLSELQIEKVSGDQQSAMRDQGLEHPFILSVMLQGKPVEGLEFGLYDDTQELTRVESNSKGEVLIYAADHIPPQKGTYRFEVKPLLRVPKKFRRQLKPLTQTFSFKIEGESCAVKWEFASNVSEEIQDVWAVEMQKFGFNNNDSAPVVSVKISSDEEGRAQGLSQENTFLKISLNAQIFTGEKEISLGSRGMGRNKTKALKNAFENARWKKEIASIQSDICNKKTQAKTVIAVLPLEITDDSRSLRTQAYQIQDELVHLALSSGRLEVVERKKINQVIAEKSLQMTGISPEIEEADLGMLSGAQALLMGTLHREKEEMVLNLRLISAKDGRILKSIQIIDGPSEKGSSMAKKAFEGLGLHKLKL